MPLRDVLSKADAIALLELIQRCTSCSEEKEIRSIVALLRDLIPFDYAICGHAALDRYGGIKSYEVVNISYPTDWIALYIQKGYHTIDPVFKENFSKFRLQYWADTYRLMNPLKDFRFDAEEFGLIRGFTHGARDRKGTEGSLFSIAGKTVERTPRSEVIIRHIVPHIGTALTAILKEPVQRGHASLSTRELEVLKWLSTGKSTWDISIILNISERTVHFHVGNIMQKLNTVSRTHAVAVALELGLIPLD